MTAVVWQTEFERLGPPRRGKVRDIYELDDLLLIVACDRISAYDHVLQPGIPGKGKILSQLSNYWFELCRDLAPNHLVATDPEDFPTLLRPYREQLVGRAVLVRRAEVIPFECVARGYLAGSGFREYREGGAVCGISLPPGLMRADRLPEAIFTPATKAESGHDENVDFETMRRHLGDGLAEQLRSMTLALYARGSAQITDRGMILADTKFEFGRIGNGEIHLIDEILTPDSSRFWDAASWKPGVEPISFDKQFVRNWLDDCGWDRESRPPVLPSDVVQGTLDRYVEAFRRITGHAPEI